MTIQDFVDFWLIHLQALLANAFQPKLKSALISKKEEQIESCSPFLEIGARGAKIEHDTKFLSELFKQPQVIVMSLDYTNWGD